MKLLLYYIYGYIRSPLNESCDELTEVWRIDVWRTGFEAN